MKRIFALLSLGLLALLSWGFAPATALAADYISKAPDDAEVYFIMPKDGATVPSPFTVQFGLANMGIAPAGVKQEGTGHHHLLVDLDELPDLKEALPATEHIKHFGGGQTQTTLTLQPGQHTLQLLLANYAHIPHDPPVISDAITIRVD